MAYYKITKSGEDFITHVCTQGGSSLLTGTNTYALPYTDPPLSKVWICNIIFNGKQIATGADLATALIFWFNQYAGEYQMDANVIAAQAYVESGYKIWNYALGDVKNQSTASGINQFTMLTIYDIIVKNTYNTEKMTQDEINIITNGLTNPTSQNSYSVYVNKAKNPTAYQNRPILHQNVINNPNIMIKAQCRYMKYFANNCGSLTSSSLFCYSRGGKYVASTYSKVIQNCTNDKKKSPTYIQEGLNYVLRIFGILGDKGNNVQQLGRKYKPLNYYFGYDNKMGDNDPRNLKLNVPFDSFNSNVSESNDAAFIIPPPPPTGPVNIDTPNANDIIGNWLEPPVK